MSLKVIVPLAAFFLAAVLGQPAWTAERTGKPASKKLPSPSKALRDAAKNLVKSGSYNAKVSIQGGISDNPEHKITESAVNEAYEGEIFGPLMHVPKIQTQAKSIGPAFRYEKKGVILVDGDWRNMLSDKTAILCQRLFTFPENVLAKAVLYSAKGAKWLPVDPATVKVAEKPGDAAATAEGGGDGIKDGAEDGGNGGAAEPAAPKKSSKEPAKAEVKKDKTGKAAGASTSKGKTVVKTSAKETEVDPLQPRVVRVEAPPQEGLKHFLEIQNSGCMGVG